MIDGFKRVLFYNERPEKKGEKPTDELEKRKGELPSKNNPL